jgi:hypothetical protein
MDEADFRAILMDDVLEIYHIADRSLEKQVDEPRPHLESSDIEDEQLEPAKKFE